MTLHRLHNPIRSLILLTLLALAPLHQAHASILEAFPQAMPLDPARALAGASTSGAALPPTLLQLEGQTGLELKADFSDAEATRACWDFPVGQDLSTLAAIHLRLFCANPQLARQFNVYFKTGGAWYSATFSPSGNRRWEDIIIPKTEFLPEGKANSWNDCRTLRIAAWKNAPGPLGIRLAAITLLGSNAPLAIVRTNGKEAMQYARHIGNSLSRLGLFPTVIDEADCVPSRLKASPFAFFAYPTAAPAAQIDAMLNYMRLGGKICAFHSLPKPLATFMQLPQGQFLKGAQLPIQPGGILPTAQLPLAKGFRQQSSAFLQINPTGLHPVAWWAESSGKATPYPAIVETRHGFWMTHVYLNQDPMNGAATLAAMAARHVPEVWPKAAFFRIHDAKQRYEDCPMGRTVAFPYINKAILAYNNGNYPDSISMAITGRELLGTQAFAQPVTIRADEMRAVWMRNRGGLPGQSWDATATLLKNAGINAVFPNMTTGYATAYPSGHLPSFSPENALQACLEACRRHGLKLHVWMSCLSVADAPEPIIADLQKAGRLQLNESGAALPWLCPNNPANRILLNQVVAELAGRYPIDGINLDVIRYPETSSCFCNACRRSFERFIHQQATSWPADVIRSGPLQKEWELFRQITITSLVSQLAAQARNVRKELVISAAVFPDLNAAKTAVGQNWTAWLQTKSIDFLTPMNYQATTALFQGQLAQQLAQVGRPDVLLPGIGVSTQRLDLRELSSQINATRAANVRGFILFEYTPREAYDLLPKLQLPH